MAKIKKIDDELKLASQGVKTATDNFNNMSYDNFKQGSMYQGLQKSYSQQGQQAMKDTLGQVAARTGGMASSYATTAANQSYNNYMQQLEDVARAMYNDEYSKARDKVSLAQNEYDRLYGEKRDALSDQRYEDEQAYLRGRDELSDQRYEDEQEYLRGRDALEDQRYNTEREEARVANDAYYGNALDYTTYQANGGTLSEQAYNSIVAAAKGKYADDHWEQNRIQDSENKAITDKKLMQMLAAEDFDWDNHDWDGDGDVDDDDKNKVDDFFDGSTYGADYWKAYAESTASDRENTRIEEEKKSGALFNTLINSADARLSADDQAVFDKAYGDGTYENVQDVIDYAKETFGETQLPHRGESSAQGEFLTKIEQMYYTAAKMLPQFSQDQIFELFDKIIPGAMRIFEDPTAYFGEEAGLFRYGNNGAGIYIAG